MKLIICFFFSVFFSLVFVFKIFPFLNLFFFFSFFPSIVSFFLFLFFDFLFFFLCLPFSLGIFFSPFFFDFIYQNFFYFFYFFYFPLAFFFYFVLNLVVISFVPFCLFFFLFIWFFFSSKFFAYNVQFFDFFLSKFVPLESDDLWVSSNFIFLDNNPSRFVSLQYRLHIKEKESYYTLIKLFFDIPFRKTVLADKSDIFHYPSVRKLKWYNFEISKLSKVLKQVLLDRMLIYLPSGASDDLFALDNIKVPIKFPFDKSKKGSVLSLRKLSKIRNSRLLKLKNTAASDNMERLVLRDNLASIMFQNSSEKIFSSSFKITDPFSNTNMLINRLNFVKFIWTTLLFLAKSDFRFVSYFTVDFGTFLFNPSLKNFRNLGNEISNFFMYSNHIKDFTPSILDLYKVCEFFFSVGIRNPDFYERYRFVIRLKKLREFYGDTIFNDLITPGDHKQSSISTMKFSADVDAPFSTFVSEAKAQEQLVLFSANDLASKLDNLVVSKPVSQPKSSDITAKTVVSNLSDVDKSKSIDNFVISSSNFKDFFQDLIVLYKYYSSRH